MEVILRADQGPMPSDDTFVSMRIGEVQKNARFAPLRTYRFNSVDPGGKAPCKLEVFRRIGHTTVTFGGSTGDIQDVEVPVVDGEKMRMRLSASTARAGTPGYTEKKRSREVNSARSYLAKHNLENLLKDAMKEVMNNKPANPHEYLAAYILKAGNCQGSLLPKLGAAAGNQEDLPIMPGKTAQLWSAPDNGATAIVWEQGQVSAYKGVPRTLPPLGQSASAPTLQPWAPTQSAVMKLSPIVAVTATVPEVAPGSLVPWKHRPSVATWYSIKPPAVAVSGPTTPAKWQLQPSVGTWCALIVKGPVPPPEVPVYRNFALRPSVATWVAPLPCPEPSDPTPYRKFNLRPSAGTWCAVRLPKSLADLTHWEPDPQETEAMNVLLRGRTNEINDLSQKLREVSAGLELARATGSAETGELQDTAEALKKCVSYAQSEYDALEKWSLRRGLSQPSSPVASPVMGNRMI